jgi:hypothetical protein
MLSNLIQNEIWNAEVGKNSMKKVASGAEFW